MGYRLLEHTADMGIEAWADSPQQLFAEAARGLTAMIVGDLEIEPQEETSLVARAGDQAGLLVDFLNEVRHLIESGGLLPAEVEVVRLDEEEIEARIRGERFDRQQHRLEREVKAVTYHQLLVEQTDEGAWKARVYVDL